ncbi:MAG TPA: response regulator [Xanthobacteraceae bacterium]|jgi:DNA-binding NarL/FixJ family response regulator|nr:response regulator [Xanthobacteraceae bacterium]
MESQTPNDLAGCRVLLIEDQSMVTMFLQDTLADIGCEVVGSASRFNDAMEKAKSLSFDIAILDINLNGDLTFSIAETLIERGLSFVFATGYGATNLPLPLQGVPTLQKPFMQRDLERAMRTALKM